MISSNNVWNYYETYPEKIPDFVFVANKDIGVGHNADNPIEGPFGEYLLSGEYEIIELKYSTVFLKK